MRALAACLALLAVLPARADEAAYAAAVQELGSPASRCPGARWLAGHGGPHALVPLLRAYHQRGEGGRSSCVLDAVEAIARATDLAKYMARAPVPDDEREAFYEAMAHAPLPRWERTLEDGALAESSPRLRGAAYRALRAQGTVDAWSEVMRGLLARAPAGARKELVQHLLDDLADPASRALLVWQAAREPDPALRAKIDARLRPRP